MPFLRSILALILLSISSLASAADFDTGLECASNGDFQCALAEWKPLAEQGMAEAQFNLGIMYENGKGVKQDYFEAVKWYGKAAEQGNAVAQNNVGAAYMFGLGVRQDKSEAKRWFGLACDNRLQIACDNYRKLNEQGY